MKTQYPQRIFWLFPVLLVLLSGLSACVQPAAVLNPTAQALADRFVQTVTAASNRAQAPSGDLEIAIQKATATAAQIETQRADYARELSAANQATQTVVAPILAELPLYEVDPTRGHTAWIHPPVTLNVDGYHQTTYENQFSTITGRDFVMAADIKWDTQYGASGCGFVLRADGDTEKPSAYMVAASRGRTGYVYFLSQYEGEPANFASIFANEKDPKFDWQKGGTNRLAVVARGKELSVYSNYTLIGKIDVTAAPTRPNLPRPPIRPSKPQVSSKDKNYQNIIDQYQKDLVKYQADYEDYKRTVSAINSAFDKVASHYNPDSFIEEGFVGLLAFAESGKVTCQFDKAWLWMIE